MVQIHLTTVEKTILLAHYRKSKSALICGRAHVVLLFDQGLSAYQISQVLFKNEKTIRGYGNRFLLERISSIFPRYDNNQNAAKLTSEQKQEIKKVLSKPPSKYGLPETFWSIKPLRSYIQATFGVEYHSHESYRLLFNLCNFSFHLPEKFDIKRNEKLIKKRITQIRKEIKPYLKDPNWVVLVSDEARIVWEIMTHRAWLPKGKKTVIKTTRKREAQSFIGFLNLKTHAPHLYPIPWQNQSQVIPVLKRIKRRYRGKQICLIWDNARWHHGKILKANLGKNKPFHNFHLINLPPYAPDTNPQEKIWRYGKAAIANIVYPTLSAVVEVFQNTIMGRKYNYQIKRFVLG